MQRRDLPHILSDEELIQLLNEAYEGDAGACEILFGMPGDDVIKKYGRFVDAFNERYPGVWERHVHKP